MIIEYLDKKTNKQKKIEEVKTFDKVIVLCEDCGSKTIKTFYSDNCKARNEISYSLCTSCARKKVMLEKYGVDSYTKTQEYKDKTKKTCLERYGVESPNKLKSKIEKTKNTFLEKYGVDSYTKTQEYKDKTKKTCLERYGVEHHSQNEKVKLKKEKTFLRRFGETTNLIDSSFIEQTKDHYIKKYGVDSYSKTQEFKDRIKITFLEKYGVDSYSKTQEFKDRIHEKKYIIVEKINKTKRKNNSFNISKKEDYVFKLLSKKYDNVIRQYSCNRYPFLCDFYIPCIDLFIECNFHWTHGGQPFDVDNNECVAILEKWKKLAENSKFYKNAIQTWTTRDTEKRKASKDSGIYIIEFFTLKSFEEWYAKNS